jgi:cellulose synthase (UDP-forming)
MQILLSSFTLGSFRWEVLLLATASFPIYHQALLNAFTGKEQQWNATGASARKSSPFTFIRPQVYLFVFLALTSVVAIWRDLNNAQFSLATAWNLTNTAALGVFMCVALAEAFGRKPARTAVPAVAPAPVPATTPARRLTLAAREGANA